MSVRFKVGTLKLGPHTEAQIIDVLAVKTSKRFQELGPYMAKVAQARCPVGVDRDITPSNRSFERLRVAPPGTFGTEGPGSSEKASRLFDLRNMSAKDRARVVSTLNEAEFFRGVGETRNKKRNKGQTPDIIEVRGNTVVGAFLHKPGTLKGSIRFTGVRREGNRVVLTVRAHAPYARPVHDGFTHRGGRHHGGKGTFIKGKPFLAWAITNVRGRLTEGYK